MSIELNRALVLRYVEEAWNQGHVAVLDELTSPDYRRHVNGCPGPLDRESHQQRLILVRHALPDMRIAIEEMIATGDRVVTRVTLCGTHKATFMGIAPTGRRVTITGMEITRIATGRIAEQWAEMDALAMIRQLGALPARAAGAAR